MWTDCLIILLLAGLVYRGWHSGFVQQFWSSAGFFTGLLAGHLLKTYTIGLGHTPGTRTLITISTFLVATLLFLSIGEFIGLFFKQRLVLMRLNDYDNGLGGFVSLLAGLFSVWLLASLVLGLPYRNLQVAVRGSHIIAALNSVLPPTPNLLSNLEKLIDPNGFPAVFIGNEPTPPAHINLPALGDFAAAVEADQDSVVRIKGQGCGGIVTGSGFVVGPGLVATNAHVVAGIISPYVQDRGGSHVGQVIWFDPDLDFAVLRVSRLAGKSLNLAGGEVPSGTPGVVLGYPGGGEFTAGTAAVLEKLNAVGRNIYGNGHTQRNIYEIKADVVPGNSGGPLIAQDGRVIGVVFAESTTYDHVGYALTADQVSADLDAAVQAPHPVNSSQCAQ